MITRRCFAVCAAIAVAALALGVTVSSAAEKAAKEPKAAEASDKAPRPATDATPAGGTVSAGELAARLKALAADERLAGAKVGLCVAEVDSGQRLFGHGENTLLAPASNMKLATTAAALVTLGRDWRFRTLVGTLGPDLVIIGGGDPNFSGRFYDGDTVAVFRHWAAKLKERGFKQIDGDLVFDDFLFEPRFVHSDWPAGQYQGWSEAPIGALVVNDSCVDIAVRGADQAGGPATILLAPATGYFRLSGQILTRGGKGQEWSAARARNSTTLLLKGDMVPGITSPVEHITAVDPGLFAATAIKETFEAEGLTIKGQVVRRRIWTRDWQLPKEFKPQVVHYSSLAQCVRVANKRSQNLYAECILKALAAFGESTDKEKLVPAAQGSWDGGRQAVAKALAGLGVSTQGCVFDDGCGLSHTNRLTAAMLTQLLVNMARRPESQLWIDSLVAAGDSEGSHRKRMHEPDLEGRVFFKTGYIDGVKALSGYVRTASGRLLAFSFLTNNYDSGEEVNKWQEAACAAMVKY